jgi:zinc/manganese transport system substrate-binding protein
MNTHHRFINLGVFTAKTPRRQGRKEQVPGDSNEIHRGTEPTCVMPIIKDKGIKVAILGVLASCRLKSSGALIAWCCCAWILHFGGGGWATEPLRVCATVPDLGGLVTAVGGDAVSVTVFARGGDDPHFVDPRPGFAKALARADLVVAVGIELEVGWLPVVLTQSRNAALAPGQPGYFEAAGAVRLLGVPGGAVDRSHGDVHPGGNPHFLTDPVCGVQVARVLAQRLGELRPELAGAVMAHYRAFTLDVAHRLLGDAVVARIGDDAAVTALERDNLAVAIGDAHDLGGWMGRLRPALGAALIADHDLWPYLARRFGFNVVGFLEPKPGVPPTTRHLGEIIALAKAQHVKAIITVPYFDPRHATLVAEQTGLPVVHLAHQVGALPAATDWLALIDSNVAALAAGLGLGAGAGSALK